MQGAFELPIRAYPALSTPNSRSALLLSMPWARQMACILLFFIGLVSFENFTPLLFGASASEEVSQSGAGFPLQQLVALTLWTILIALSSLPGVLRTPPQFRGLFWPTLFLAYAVISPVWSNNPVSSASKALAMLVCTAGAWRAAAMISIEDMFACFAYSLSALLLASLALVLLIPSIGVAHYWQHDGLWSGVFEQKQGLGTSSAFLAFVTLLRLSRRWTRFDISACLLALVCLIGSGSRGGVVLAVVSAGCLLIARRYPRLVPFLTNIIVIELILGNVLVIFFAVTGYKYIFLFGYQIDVTERTFIWQFAVTYWTSHPFFGYGLNGFWTDPTIFYDYLRTHQWILDNYHNGYIAIMAETGITGMVLFSVVVGKLASRLRLSLKATSASSLGLELTLGFLILFFTINLTETLFLRSTSFTEILFSFLVIKVLTKQRAHAIDLPLAVRI